MLSTPVDLRIGGLVHVDLDLHAWINEAAMALFFLVAGLEIKRQVTVGELSDRRAAALPVVAALGGMLVPAGIYVLVNAGAPGQRGWGIPMATDIAFAVGVVSLAGRRIPVAARLFLLTLAVADDVGGIVVIALFYASSISFGWLGLGALAVAATTVLRRADVRSIAPYALLGAICWYSFYKGGVEPAIVGVIFGLLTPVHPFHHRREGHPPRQFDDDPQSIVDTARWTLEHAAPLDRIEMRLGMWVAFVIVPIFALANAGVRISADSFDARVALGIVLGLVVGKPIGIVLACFVGVRTGIARLPNGVGWKHIVGLGATAGIGFTVALFVTSLSFDHVGLTDSAKIGTLAASAISAIIGTLSLRRVRA
jgi:NhaA family Na+:H+ antiporter